MMIRNLRSTLLVSSFALLALAFAGCDDDNPASPQGGEEHADLDGVVLALGDGTELVRQWEGTITGTIELTAGVTATDLEVWFLDEDGDLVRPEDDHTHVTVVLAREEHDGEHEEYELEFEVDNTSIASAAMTDGEEWAVDLTGVAVGNTTIRFIVLHEEHADFTSLALPIEVDAAVPRQ